MIAQLTEILKNQRETVIAMQRMMVAIPALSPDNGGEGESKKAEGLQKMLAGFGFPEPMHMNAPDARVPAGHRPNFAYIFPGEDTSRTLWIFAHIDVVPSGDPSLWNTPPFELHVDGDRLYGRGVEDNHQGVVTAALLGKALCEAKAKPPINLGLLYLADEETQNHYGLYHVMKHHADLFKIDDLFLVPDHGEPDGLFVEVAEKCILWVKVIVEGKQCHASMPHLGKNSLRASAAFITRIDELAARFNREDPLFVPARSTFEPTKKEANVDGVNILPGRDVFYIDCRILPDYRPEDVLASLRAIGAEVEAKIGVRVTCEEFGRTPSAPATPTDSEIVRRVCTALRSVKGGEPRIQGVGGGTFAGPLRAAGYKAVVWSTLLENAHQPNETSRISATMDDAIVMAHVLFDRG